MKKPIHQTISLQDGFQQMALLRLRRSHKALNSAYQNKVGAVHEARKQFKEIRALIRLIRGILGNETYRRENIFFRDLGRMLSPIRDKDVVIEKFEETVQQCEDDRVQNNASEIEDEIKKYYKQNQLSEAQIHERINRVIAGIDESFLRILNWPELPASFDPISDGLFRAYKHAYDDYCYSCIIPTDSVLHEWRKKVKYLRHHYEFISEIWPVVLADVAGEVHKLTDWLGSDHDLVLLRDTLQRVIFPQNLREHIRPLIPIIDKKRNRYQRQVFVNARRIFAMKPDQHLDWIRKCWDAYELDQTSSMPKPVQKTH